MSGEDDSKSGIDSVNNIYCISLPFLPARRTACEIIAEKEKLKVKFVDAVPASQINTHRFASLVNPKTRAPEDGAVACLFSHMLAMERIAETTSAVLDPQTGLPVNALDVCLVLEDDFELRFDFRARLAEILEMWNRRAFGVVVLSPYIALTDARRASQIQPIAQKGEMFLLRSDPEVWSTVGYLVTVQYARECFARFCAKESCTLTSETAITMGAHCLFAMKPLVIETGAASNILEGRATKNLPYFNQFRKDHRYSAQMYPLERNSQVHSLERSPHHQNNALEQNPHFKTTSFSPLLSNMPMFVLNLERRLDRKRRCEALASSRGLVFEFMPGVEASAVCLHKWVSHISAWNEKHTTQKTAPQAAKFLAHMQVMARLAESANMDNDQVCLVLEDDADLHLQFEDKLQQLLQVWDSKLQGCLILSPLPSSPPPPSSAPTLSNSDPFICSFSNEGEGHKQQVCTTTGYLVTKAHAKECLRRFLQQGLQEGEKQNQVESQDKSVSETKSGVETERGLLGLGLAEGSVWVRDPLVIEANIFSDVDLKGGQQRQVQWSGVATHFERL